MTGSNLLFLRFQDLLLLLGGLLRQLTRRFSPQRVPLDGLKIYDLLFPLSHSHFHPSRVNRLQLTINLLSFLSLAATLCLLLNHPVGFLCQSSTVLFQKTKQFGIAS
jgi:hypothetical protein